MSRSPRHRGLAYAVATVIGGCSLAPLLLTTPAWADADLSQTTVDVGAAAAIGAGSEVSALIGDSAVAAAVQIAATALTTPPAAAKPAVAAAGDSGPSSGWVSGAAGAEAEDGRFATFRAKPLGVVAVWSDTTEEAQTQLDAVDTYASFNGEMDIAVGALVRGETWQQAAAGNFVTRWTTAIRNLKAKRAGKGTTYVRIAHEFNGDWMAWGVNASNLAAYKQGYRLYAGIVRKEFPQAKLTWSPNGGNHNTLTMDQMYPGGDVVDVIGPDDYDGYPPYTDASIWNDIVNQWTNAGTPRGLGAWALYAAKKGKPLAVPEWGMQSGDHPAYIQGVHDFMIKHAAAKGGRAVVGKLIYDCYYNVEDKFKLTSGAYPDAAAKYASLTWGG